MLSHKTLQEAAQWFATLSDESVTEQQKSAWARWLNQHSQHRQAWHYVENVGQRFHKASQLAQSHEVGHTLAAARTGQLTRRKTLQGLGALCAMGLFWRFTPLPKITQNYTVAWGADQHTVTGEIRELALQDGGQVWLNTASAININYQASKREIALLAGEILIQTAADLQSRPFFVETPQGNLQALGTRFTVREQGETTSVAVYEGAVKIQTTSGKTQTINAGQQAQFNQHHIQPYTTTEGAHSAWVRGLVVANNITLKSLIAEINRYQVGHIAINPSIENLRVMGTYPSNQPDHVLAMLEAALPIKAQRILPWWITLQPSD